MGSLPRRPSVSVIDVTLGRSPIAAVAATVVQLLRDPGRTVIINVNRFSYFDEHDLAALVDLTTWSPRVLLIGLDRYAEIVLPTAPMIDVRSAAERAVSHLSSVTVVTAAPDGHPLDDHEFSVALAAAVAAGRATVAVDLRGVEFLSPAPLLALAETSAELRLTRNTLIIANAVRLVEEQIRLGGLSGGLPTSPPFQT